MLEHGCFADLLEGIYDVNAYPCFISIQQLYEIINLCLVEGFLLSFLIKSVPHQCASRLAENVTHWTKHSPPLIYNRLPLFVACPALEAGLHAWLLLVRYYVYLIGSQLMQACFVHYAPQWLIAYEIVCRSKWFRNPYIQCCFGHKYIANWNLRCVHFL